MNFEPQLAEGKGHEGAGESGAFIGSKVLENFQGERLAHRSELFKTIGRPFDEELVEETAQCIRG